LGRLPLAARRSPKSRKMGLYRLATSAGMYNALRIALEPCLLIGLVPVQWPDCRTRGLSPTKAPRKALIYSVLPAWGRMPQHEQKRKSLIRESHRGRVPR
jgi:hypothetical protein